jgi:hypothetical protein
MPKLSGVAVLVALAVVLSAAKCESPREQRGTHPTSTSVKKANR